jgi:two-component system, chemotaxis family, protein-glutamate methylesterase/glutaminase
VGADVTLEALSAGAQDFATKPFGDSLTFENAALMIRNVLLPKIQQFIVPQAAPIIRMENVPAGRSFSRYPVEKSLPSVVVIGSSTGGPAALEEVLRGLLGKRLRCPVLITQHMPPVFTASLAQRFEKLTGIPCSEGKHHDQLENKIYVAPGDFHMSLGRINGEIRLILDQGPQRNYVRPAVDPLFETAAEIYKNRCVGIVLTGMGVDGALGAIAIKEKGGGMVIQNRESCIVYGMPLAVYEQGAYDQIADLHQIRELLLGMVT